MQNDLEFHHDVYYFNFSRKGKQNQNQKNDVPNIVGQGFQRIPLQRRTFPSIPIMIWNYYSHPKISLVVKNTNFEVMASKKNGQKSGRLMSWGNVFQNYYNPLPPCITTAVRPELGQKVQFEQGGVSRKTSRYFFYT